MTDFLKRRWRPIAAVLAVLVLVGAAAFTIYWFQGSPEPSGPTLAPTLAVPAAAPATPATPPPATAVPDQAAAPSPTPQPAPDPDPVTTLAPSASGDAVLYRFGPDNAAVSFAIDEILNNAPFTAVGFTGEAAGDIIIDWEAPQNSQLGTIVINARTLETDSAFRDRAIRNSILESSQDEYEFITFTPTELRGLPAQVAVGETVAFEVVGDLTIRDITLSTVWSASVTLHSEEAISATASTEVLRSDYDLQIPSVPRVAGVDDDVLLTIEFRAQRVV